MRLVDRLQDRGSDAYRVELSHIPVGIASAVGSENGEAFAVRRPVELVNIHISGRELRDAAGSYVNYGETLLEDFVGDHAGFGDHGQQRIRSTRRIFGEQKGDRFAIRRPGRIGESPGYRGELAGDSVGWSNIE